MYERLMSVSIAFLFGMLVGMVIIGSHYKDRIQGIGIDRIDKYTVEGPNLSSNWYEIVWLPGRAPKK